VNRIKDLLMQEIRNLNFMRADFHAQLSSRGSMSTIGAGLGAEILREWERVRLVIGMVKTIEHESDAVKTQESNGGISSDFSRFQFHGRSSRGSNAGPMPRGLLQRHAVTISMDGRDMDIIFVERLWRSLDTRRFTSIPSQRRRSQDRHRLLVRLL
jgi:hypothetical protein